MEELDIAIVTRRSIHGVMALVTRTAFIQIIAFTANLLLTIFLSPSVFGVYFVVTAAIAFLSYFSDIGLAAALIQKKEDVTQKELQTTFTIQQIIVVTSVIIALLFSGTIASFYHLNKDGLFLFQALVISFFFSSLKTIPSIILERNLRFERLVIPQIVETIFYYGIAVILAAKGFGLYSFTFAVLARGITGLITIYLIAPWKVRIGFSKPIAKRLLSYGVPFQTNSILALIKDNLLIVFLGKVLPFAQIGYIGFAQQWAYQPLRLIMDNVIRVSFPAFSRLQHDKEALGKAIEKALFASSFFIFPSLTGLVILFPYFIHILPKYHKWEPAILSLALFSLNAAMSSLSTPLTNALNAVGKIKISLYLMMFWTTATWILTPLAIFFFGYNGVALVSVIISLTAFYVVYIMKKYVNFNFLGTIKTPLLASLVMGVSIALTGRFFVNNFFTMGLTILLGIIIYGILLLLLAKDKIIADIMLIKKNIK